MVFDAIAAYAAARRLPNSRAELEKRQASRLTQLRQSFALSPALAPYADAELSQIPVIDTATFRAHFAAYSTVGLSHTDLFAAAEAAEHGHTARLPNGLSAGFSTGTGGGTRGLFVTSPQERSVYAGLLAGKLFSPTDLLRVKRIAVCLRAGNPLYDRGRVRFFPLDLSGRDEAMERYDPQVLIAPPQVLIALATRGRVWPDLRRLFYGAETLNESERVFITARLGVRPDPIYQATEGFLGAPCRLGTLHLNEDSLVFEREEIGGGRFRPVVTDLLRRSQLIVRLRLDDCLRPVTCACGSPLSAVAPVEGRMQDVWRWGDRVVWPAEVETTVTARTAPQHRWVATGHPEGIDYACEEDADAPALHAALTAFGQPLRRVSYDPREDMPKRRHVRWRA
ncbi:MAG: cell division protein FtsA [Asticcacaulis sp.]